MLSSITNRRYLILVLLCILAGFGLILLVFTVFSGRYVLPQALEIGFFSIRYYGLVMALAVLAGYTLALKRAVAYGITTNEAERLIFWAVIFGFVGARLYHVASSWQYYAANPIRIFEVWSGGLGIFGAMFGGVVLAVCVWAFKSTYFQDKRISILSLLDWGALSFVLGQIIGRFGNLFNYEAYGYPTVLPWKMFVPESFRPVEFLHQEFYHPLFLYEALGNIGILIVLLILENKNAKNYVLNSGKPGTIFPLPKGSLFFGYLFLYNSLRFFIEFLRTDSTWVYGIRLNSATSLVLALVGLAGIMFVRSIQVRGTQLA